MRVVLLLLVFACVGCVQESLESRVARIEARNALLDEQNKGWEADMDEWRNEHALWKARYSKASMPASRIVGELPVTRTEVIKP